jgi:anti-anti-sigma factor
VTEPAKPVVVDVREALQREPSRPQVLTEQVRSLLEEGAHYILLNVVNITYADSLVLGAVMQAYASAIKRGATLKLTNTTERFRQLLTVTKLDRIIETVDSTPHPPESSRPRNPDL